MPAIQGMWIKRLCRSLPIIDHERRTNCILWTLATATEEDRVIEHFCDWLVATPLSTAFQTWTWFVPLVQIVHIICISVVFTVVLRIGARLLSPHLKLGTFGAFLGAQMPAIWTAMVVLLVSGTLLTITEPARELLNWAFRTKMVLVLLLVGVVVSVRRVTRGSTSFDDNRKTRAAARATAILMLVLGIAIITAGRWIAYV